MNPHVFPRCQQAVQLSLPADGYQERALYRMKMLKHN